MPPRCRGASPFEIFDRCGDPNQVAGAVKKARPRASVGKGRPRNLDCYVGCMIPNSELLIQSRRN
jgi:hypothetical protein